MCHWMKLITPSGLGMSAEISDGLGCLLTIRPGASLIGLAMMRSCESSAACVCGASRPCSSMRAGTTSVMSDAYHGSPVATAMLAVFSRSWNPAVSMMN